MIRSIRCTRTSNPDFLRSWEAGFVSEFRLELECSPAKVDQLQQIVEDLRSAGEPKDDGEEARWTLAEPVMGTTRSDFTDLGGTHERAALREYCRFTMV